MNSLAPREQHRRRASTLKRNSLEFGEDILWKKWDEEANPDAFGFLDFAKDGGFSEVGRLYENGTAVRWLYAASRIIYIFYNIISVLYLDLTFMFVPEKAAERRGTTLPRIERFYLSATIVQMVALKFRINAVPYYSVSILGFVELIGLIGILGRLVHDIVTIRLSHGFTRWFTCQNVFREIVPRLSVYSGMRFLHCIIPIIFIDNARKLLALVGDARKDPKFRQKAICGVLQWPFLTMAMFIVGFDTFLMKLRIVTAAADSDELTVWSFLPTVQFFIQVVGVVPLGVYTRERLWLFIFGGEDAILQDEEIVNMNTWNALLAKHIFESSKSFVQFLVVMLSFSNNDFQRLVLNENENKKSEMPTGAFSAALQTQRKFTKSLSSGFSAIWSGSPSEPLIPQVEEDISRSTSEQSLPSPNIPWREVSAAAQLSTQAQITSAIEALQSAMDVLNKATADHKENVFLAMHSRMQHSTGEVPRQRENLQHVVPLGEIATSESDAVFIGRLLGGEEPSMY